VYTASTSSEPPWFGRTTAGVAVGAFVGEAVGAAVGDAVGALVGEALRGGVARNKAKSTTG
jgi:hypothetical protein